MAFILDTLQHRRDCGRKQQERARLIGTLTRYHGPFTATDRVTITSPIEDLVRRVQIGALLPLDLLRTYGKLALKAHARTNCVTEILLPSAEEWLGAQGGEPTINLSGPLAGIPISLKDTILVAGYDATVGYSRFVGHSATSDGPMVRLLKDAGAVPYVKTNVPITLLSFESTNDVWGRTTNPHNAAFSPGGSTGGESALLALGGRIGMGSDVAGSVRVPAHFSGCYSLRCSTGRWPKTGTATCMPGQEGVPSVYSPMARTLGDLAYFTRAVVGMRPWTYDHAVHPLPWRRDMEREFAAPKRILRVGVLRTDGVVDPSPACARALDVAAAALRRAGHDVVELTDPAQPALHPPDMYAALRTAALLLNADGCRMVESWMRAGERHEPGVAQMARLMRLPRPLRWLYWAWVRYVRRDPVWAGLVRDWRPHSAYENWLLVKRREAHRAEWFAWWQRAALDVLLAPPNATPAVPHNGMAQAVSSCGYTFLFNYLDYTAGVMPVTHVDRAQDALPTGFRLGALNGVAQGAYTLYDADAMHGLPVGVQIVGRRLDEEKVLAVMGRLEDALGTEKYQLLDIDILD